MAYLTAKQLSLKWGISERRIIKLCNENRINGAIKNGMVWVIPEDTIKPSDKRSKISKYINTQKRVMIANFNNPIGYNLIPLLKKEGYIVDGLYDEKTNIDAEKLNDIEAYKVNYDDENDLEKMIEGTSKYYDGLILIEVEEKIKNAELLINSFSKKMDSEASIVLVNNKQEIKVKLEEKLSYELKSKIGLRINALNIDAPINNNVLIDYNEIADNILELLIGFKNTTGVAITTDGGYLEFDKNGRTKPLETGKLYKAINYYFKTMTKDSHLWCASTMMEDEWTEEPLEMNFRVINLDAANRGAKIDRIFIFSKSKIKEFKNNKTLKIYMQSNINTLFVDYDEIKEKEPELLNVVRYGFDGLDDNTLMIDLPSGTKERGYYSINKQEIKKAYECFKKLMKYAKDLKEVLK